jgi:hypothetical protein
LGCVQADRGSAGAYVVVDTGQTNCYDATSEISAPSSGEAFYGQDAQFEGALPSYQDNGDGTVTDLNTGLMWQQNLLDEKVTYSEAQALAENFTLAGYDDWRLPTIKELYSLILFSGTDPIAEATDITGLVPFIDTDYFDFRYGDPDNGDRIIDSQFVSSTEYVYTTMNNAFTVFGVNFADGRIKGYPAEDMGGGEKTFEVLFVRENLHYGKNLFEDNNDGTISDLATGLMWSQTDSAEGMTWEQALEWVEQINNENYLGYSDWRLPNAKELQSIVDYSRSSDTTGSAAIDPVFSCTSITNEEGQTDYAYYWTGTTHVSVAGSGSTAVYLSFGRAMGYMKGQWMDVHGAGAQRSDPKTGNPDDYPYGMGPQGDARRIYNYVRLVRTQTQTEPIPEFPTTIIIHAFMVATLVVILIYRKKTHTKN